MLLHLSGWNESGADKRNESEKTFVKKQRNMFCARIKIMWEEQLVDPQIDYITSINVP